MALAPVPNGSTDTERLGTYTASSQVVGALRNASASSGISFGLLASKAAMESGFQPGARAATSSARGLFQFTDQTWLAMVQQHGARYDLGQEASAIQAGPGGRLTVQDPAQRERILALRDDPQLSANFACEYMRGVSNALTPVLGRRPDASELYLGHFLGNSGATKMLQALASNPDQPANAVMPAAAAANVPMFYGSDGTPLSVGQFMDRIRTRLNRTYANLGLTAPVGPVAFNPPGTQIASAEPAATRTAPGEPNGWGNGAPVRVALGAERAMVSNLTKVFARMGRAHAAAQARRPAAGEIPAAMLGALREEAQPGATRRT